MVRATTGKPEVKACPSQEVLRLRIVPVQPIDVYLTAFASPIDIVGDFTDSGEPSRPPWQAIAISTLVYSAAESGERHRVPAQPKAAERVSRMAEINWLSRQGELRKRLAGQWVAVEGEHLIAHGPRLIEVLAEARSQGVEHPLVVCLPEVDEEEVAIIA